MERVDEEAINYDLIEDILRLLLFNESTTQHLPPPEGADLNHGSILVFLPGLGEIRTLSDRLQGQRHFSKCEIIQLHSSLSSSDQKRAFRDSPVGSRKIIISTNIAETSVTIPDIVCGKWSLMC